MIKYRHLKRNPVDELFHRALFLFYALQTQLLPIPDEFRTYLAVFTEFLANLCKFFFRPSSEASEAIARIIHEYKTSYEETGQEKVAIVTGGTSGIGRVMAEAVAEAGFHVILPVRNRVKGERVRQEILANTGKTRITLMDCDLVSLKSVRAFADAFKAMNLPLSLLINNAGVYISDRKPTEDGFEPNMAINYISHYVLTEALLPAILAKGGVTSTYGTRIVNVSSASFYSVSSLEEKHLHGRAWFERFAPYARSKLAQVLYTLELDERIRSSTGHLTVNCMEPGMVLTDIYRYSTMAQILFKHVLAIFTPFVMLKPEEGAVTALWLALSPDLHQISGKVFSDLHEIPLGLNVERIHRMMPDHMTSLTQRSVHK